MMTCLLGFDIGSSSVKATLLEAEGGRVVATATSPGVEMEIIAQRAGWAEQEPEGWWEHLKICAAELKAQAPTHWQGVEAIGIAYQMHGLVVVDKNHEVLRPAIIWCDSRAVEIGAEAASRIGPQRCLEHLLNHPGNFTASKLKWVEENEPELYRRIDKMMLPGDFIAMKMTGEITTTPTGLSEGMLWDYQRQALAELVLEDYGITPDLIPRTVGILSPQGELTSSAAADLGLKPGIKIAYRAGDQPNNALSLKVLKPGELAATAGTSGVVYGVTDQIAYDPQCRVNTFLHVNHLPEAPSHGVLLCVNGAGILNSWLKRNFAPGDSYEEINARAAGAPVGSDGLSILPFGNGAERMLENRDLGGSLHGLNFNIHERSHILRAAQEGIAFALNRGIAVMREMGMAIDTVRAGRANLFLSPLFCEAFATVTGTGVELFNTDGAQGAARGAGLGAGIYADATEAFTGLECVDRIEPNYAAQPAYDEAYERWSALVDRQLN
jgi:xylulokinase